MRVSPHLSSSFSSPKQLPGLGVQQPGLLTRTWVIKTVYKPTLGRVALSVARSSDGRTDGRTDGFLAPPVSPPAACLPRVAEEKLQVMQATESKEPIFYSWFHAYQGTSSYSCTILAFAPLLIRQHVLTIKLPELRTSLPGSCSFFLEMNPPKSYVSKSQIRVVNFDMNWPAMLQGSILFKGLQNFSETEYLGRFCPKIQNTYQ